MAFFCWRIAFLWCRLLWCCGWGRGCFGAGALVGVSTSREFSHKSDKFDPLWAQVGGQQVVQQRPPGGQQQQQQQVIRQATAPGQVSANSILQKIVKNIPIWVIFHCLIFLVSQPGQQQMAGIQRVVINQPGLRPGQPGAQITVPLSTLQVEYASTLSYYFLYSLEAHFVNMEWGSNLILYLCRRFRLARGFPLVSLVTSWSRQKLASIR